MKIKPKVYDKRISKILIEDNSAIDRIEASFFHECFVYGLNETVLHILDHDPEKGRRFFSESYSEYDNMRSFKITKNPLVQKAFRASQEVVLKILKVCHRQIASNMEQENSCGENILHILIGEGYDAATNHVINAFKREKISTLCFGIDRNESYPLLSALSKNSIKDEKLLLKLWTIMVESKKKELIGTISRIDNRKNNIFHLCATFKQDNLFREVANLIWCEEKVIVGEVLRALFEANPDGKLPFHLCQSEDLIVDLLNKIQTHEKELGIDMKTCFIEVKTKKNNTCLNLFAKKNFKKVIDWVMDYMPDARLKMLIMETNGRGNNPPMVCAVYNRNDILKRFLMFLFSAKHVTKDEIWKFLHHRNGFDETILSLVLQHESTLLLPQMLLLDKEKEIHICKTKKETMLALTSCLKENDLRSSEVAITIKKADNSFKKVSTWEKFKAIISILAFTLAVPLTVQGMDMSFDALVVFGNWIKFIEENNTIHKRNTTFRFQKSCQFNVSDKLSHIPEDLRYLPRFCYSISFIIVPWFFYLIEFLISRYLKETEDKVGVISKYLCYSHISFTYPDSSCNHDIEI